MSTGITLTIKWGKQSHNVLLDLSKGVAGLKADLEERTGVEAGRQKLMGKTKGLWKGVLKDDFDLTTIDFAAIQAKHKEISVLLMGSATKLAVPKQKTVFLEDLPPEEKAKVAPEPSGLVNLGNTCYLNSVVQCLRAIPVFRNGLSHYSPLSTNGNGVSAAGVNRASTMLLSSLRDLYQSLDRTTEAVPPANFVMATKMAFPQFAQTGPQGRPMQQDAEEFYSQLMMAGATELGGTENIRAGFSGAVLAEEELSGADNLVDAMFGLKMEETLTCDELDTATNGAEGEGEGGMEESTSATEAQVKSYDLLRKLVCNIQGGSDSQSQTNVNHISEGIALSLNGKIEKHSNVLGRNAVWTRKQRIARLPPYLVVQFGRFYWKATPDSQDHSGVKCKVMKPVAFSNTLDIYEFCAEKLQEVLKVSRDKALKEEEDHIAKKLRAEPNAEEKGSDEAKMETSGDDDDEELKAALAMSMETTLPPVGPGLPENFQGIYELFAVVTHKGRDADGGHYMGWVKGENCGGETAKIADTDVENEEWFVFDDDEVSPCKTEDVLKLKGGGDWHMSYLNFYRAKK